MLEGVTFMNGRICVKIDDAQQPFQVSMQDGRVVSDNTIEPSPVKPLVQAKSVRHVEEKLETMVRKTYPSAGSEIWHGPPGAINVMYAHTVTAVRNRSSWLPRVRCSHDDNWSAFAQAAGASRAFTTAGKPRWTSLSSNSSTMKRASSIGHCRTQTSSIRGGSEGRSRTMSWITFEGIASGFEKQEDRIRIPTSFTGHSRWKN